MRRFFSFFAICFSTAALADLTLVNEALTNGKLRHVTLSAKGNKAFFEMKEADGPARTMLHDATARKMYLIDHAQKSVIVIDEVEPQQQEQTQGALRAQLQKQLEKMPAEKRARMEASMLGQDVAETSGAAFTYEKKTGAPRKVSGFKCEDYLIKREGKMAGEGCFAAWKTMGISAEEFRATMLKAMPNTPNGNSIGQSFDAQLSAPGFPVWRTHVDAQGKVVTEMTVKTLSKAALPAERFEVPVGYVEKSMSRPVK